MALNIDAKFEGKLTCPLRNGNANLVNFYKSTHESLKIWPFIESFYPKLKMYEFKIYMRFMCHEKEQLRKIWGGMDLSIKNWYEMFDIFWPEHSKISNIGSLISCFSPKHIMFELKKRLRNYVWLHWTLM